MIMRLVYPAPIQVKEVDSTVEAGAQFQQMVRNTIVALFGGNLMK